MATTGALASELDRNLKLSLSNGEWEALIRILDANPEREAKRLAQATPQAVRAEIRAARKAA